MTKEREEGFYQIINTKQIEINVINVLFVHRSGMTVGAGSVLSVSAAGDSTMAGGLCGERMRRAGTVEARRCPLPRGDVGDRGCLRLGEVGDRGPRREM